ncbi:amiloride-sensitive sodium channel-related [Holotrichia oblita]|uniref:Amiloride-sensitive sodium channel-related n=1 Tax=Holotrichia oblita TaxID=644536 RepID=A0ACB9T6X4_HOLOL|nr:amiloride-sensitive sodium channel-related [Holotrichia oblita]
MNRYQDSPVLNVITSTGYPVWKSPFPTVAVCNHNVVYKSNSGNITKILAVKEEPFYTGGAGLGSGLTVTINVEPTQYISSVKTIPGVTIFAHSGYKYPQMGVQYNSISIGEVLSFELEQSVFQSDTDIVRLTPESRGCLFEHEGRSNWTGIYNSQTCFNECKANYITRVCDCIPFYYPTINNTRVCTFSDLPCLHSNRKNFVNLMLSDDIKADTEYMHQHGVLFPEFCYCLPNCNEVTYLLHDEKKKISEKPENNFRLSSRPPTNETCVVNVYYNSVAGILRIRTAILTWDTLLGTIGGTFGLCMGGSVISMLEFLFYFIQALFGKRFIEKQKKRNNKPHTWKINVLPNTQKIHSLHM